MINRNASDIHIEYEEDWYDQELSVECNVTFSSPSVSDKITVRYSSESSSVIQTQIAKDIAEYMQNPKEWTRKYTVGGKDNQLKLREFEVEAEEYRNRIKSYQSSIGYTERALKYKEEEIAEVKAKITEAEKGDKE